MAYEIEKGIPIPKKSGVGAKDKYPWRNMEIGDSFVIPADKVRAVRNAATSAQVRLGMRFKTRTVKGVARVWRIA